MPRVIPPRMILRNPGTACGASSGAELRSPPLFAAIASALSMTLTLGGCSSFKSGTTGGLEIFPPTGPRASARLIPRNGSSINGRVTFVQRGGKVAVFATIFELKPGPHSVYIHQTGNCSSPNAASAGPVWNATTSAGGERRDGDLPELQANTEGMAQLSVEIRGLSVGNGAAGDVIGHSVVVHDGLIRDPRPEFGVANGWIACGVIERE